MGWESWLKTHMFLPFFRLHDVTINCSCNCTSKLGLPSPSESRLGKKPKCTKFSTGWEFLTSRFLRILHNTQAVVDCKACLSRQNWAVTFHPEVIALGVDSSLRRSEWENFTSHDINQECQQRRWFRLHPTLQTKSHWSSPPRQCSWTNAVGTVT